VYRDKGESCWIADLNRQLVSQKKTANNDGSYIETMSEADDPPTNCLTVLNPDQIAWQTVSGPGSFAYESPDEITRSLSFGIKRYVHGAGKQGGVAYNGFDADAGMCLFKDFNSDLRVLTRERDTGWLKFRAPRHYDTNTTVILTFEGVDYAGNGTPLDLSQVKFRGQDPIDYSNETQTVSYRLTVDGGKQYPLVQDDFKWPEFHEPGHASDSYFDPVPCPYIKSIWHAGTWLTDQHWLQWTNFHNLAIEFLDKDKSPTKALRVGKWENAFEGNPATGVKANFIDLDPDRFYVRVNDQTKKGAGKVSIFLSTDSAGTDYDDGPTEIELSEIETNGGIFLSKSLLLVSGSTDDLYQVDGIADGAKNDRTYKVALNATVYSKHPSFEHKVSAVANGNRTVTFHVNILKTNGTPVVTTASVEEDMRQVAERFAQMQINVAYTIAEPVDPPSGVDLSDGIDEMPESVSITAEEEALLGVSALRTATDGDIEVYYVNRMSGTAFAESFPASVVDSQYKNSIIVGANRISYQTLAHEAGHLLLNAGGHYEGAHAEQNLMYYAGVSDHTVRSPKRVTKDQAASFRASPLAK
jgi:hypothetical protein